MKFINHRKEGEKNRQVGTTHLVGRYIVMECENEMDAFEAFTWFRDAEKAALEAAEYPEGEGGDT